MIKHADEIRLLESARYSVCVLGKGARNASTMYRVRKGRGRIAILDEQGLLDLVEVECAGRECSVRRGRRAEI